MCGSGSGDKKWENEGEGLIELQFRGGVLEVEYSQGSSEICLIGEARRVYTGRFKVSDFLDNET